VIGWFVALVAGCGPSPSEVDPTRPSEPLVPGPVDDDPVQQIRSRYLAIESSVGPAETTLERSCRGGEIELAAHTNRRAGAVQKVQLDVGHAGHLSEAYHVYFDAGGDPVFVLHQRTTWSFAPGSDPETPETEEDRTETRYYFVDGEPFQCLRKQAEAPTDAIQPAMDRAQNEPTDCAQAGRVHDLATRLGDGDDRGITSLVCS